MRAGCLLLLRLSCLFLYLVFVPSSTSALSLKGNFIEGGWIIGYTKPGARIFLGVEEVKVGKDGLFLMGFGRDDMSSVQITEIFPNGDWRPHFYSVAQRVYVRQYLTGLPEAMVTPDENTIVRIKNDRNNVWAARDHFSDERYFLSSFRWPVEGPITGIYGSARILNGQERQPHYGIDIAVKEGTPIRAPASGTIRLAEPDLYLTGGTVILDHGFGFSSAFLHLRSLSVRVGQKVRQGDLLGHVGQTGRATGAHLDWRLNWGQVRLDPQFAVPAMKAPEGGWGFIPTSIAD